MTYPPPGYGQPSQPWRPQVPPYPPPRNDGARRVPPLPPSPPPRNGLGTAGLVLGIIGLVFAFIPIVGVIAWPLVILGLILGVLGMLRANRGQATNRGAAIGGVACSGLGLVVCFAWAFLFAAVAPTTPTTTSAAGASSGTQQRAVPASAPTATQQTPTVIQVKHMGDDFEANQVAAEKKWGGKYIQFTAPVSNINSSGLSFHDVTSKFSFTQVSCDLEDESAMLNLAKGKPATVRGIVDNDQLLGVISLNECQVVGATG